MQDGTKPECYCDVLHVEGGPEKPLKGSCSLRLTIHGRKTWEQMAVRGAMGMLLVPETFRVTKGVLVADLEAKVMLGFSANTTCA